MKILLVAINAKYIHSNLAVELLVSLSRLHLLLHHLVLLGGEVTDLTNELCEPRLLGKLGVVILNRI